MYQIMNLPTSISSEQAPTQQPLYPYSNKLDAAFSKDVALKISFNSFTASSTPHIF